MDTNQNQLVLLVGPSGAGKDALGKGLCEADSSFSRFKTYTTRPLISEEDSEKYNHVTPRQFAELMKDNGGKFFAETATIHGNLYGTPREFIAQTLLVKNVVRDLDYQGAKILRSSENFPDALTIFVLPPSRDEMIRRIKDRKRRESDTEIEVRLKTAEEEMKSAHEFGAWIINDDLNVAVRELRTLIARVKNFGLGQGLFGFRNRDLPKIPGFKNVSASA